MREYQIRWMFEASDGTMCGDRYWRPATAAEIRGGKAVLSVYERDSGGYWMWQHDFTSEKQMRALYGNKVTIDPVED